MHRLAGKVSTSDQSNAAQVRAKMNAGVRRSSWTTDPRRGCRRSRTFYAKGQTGQQLLLGAYSALSRQISKGKVKMYNRHEMMDVVLVDGKARGIIARNLVTGEIERHSAHAVVLASGGYGNVFFLSTNAMGSNVSAAWKAHRKEPSWPTRASRRFTPRAFP